MTRTEHTPFLLKATSLLLAVLAVTLVVLCINEGISLTSKNKGQWFGLAFNIPVVIYLIYLSSLFWRSRTRQIKTSLIVVCSIILFSYLIGISLRVSNHIDQYPSTVRLLISVSTFILPFVIPIQFYKLATRILFPYSNQSIETNKNG